MSFAPRGWLEHGRVPLHQPNSRTAQRSERSRTEEPPSVNRPGENDSDEEYEEIAAHWSQERGTWQQANPVRAGHGPAPGGQVNCARRPERLPSASSGGCAYCGSGCVPGAGISAPSTVSINTVASERTAFEAPRAPGSVAPLGPYQSATESIRTWHPLYRDPLHDSSLTSLGDRHVLTLWNKMTASGRGEAILPEESWEPAMALMASLQALEEMDSSESGPFPVEDPYTQPRPHPRNRKRKPLPPLPPAEVSFEENDPANPHSWSRKHRWLITVLVGATMFNATFASTAPNGALSELVPEFGLDPVEGVLVTTIFVGGCVAGPIFWAPLSEMQGRRIAYLISTALYTVVQIGCALAPEKRSLLFFRFWSGAFASSSLTNAGGVITDMFPPIERGPPMIVFTLAPFIGRSWKTAIRDGKVVLTGGLVPIAIAALGAVGPVIGPLVGAGIIALGSWRCVFWLLLIIGGVLEVLMLVFLPETYAPLILSRRARRLREETKDQRWFGPLDRRDKSIRSIVMVNFARPLLMLVKEPIVASATVFMSYLFALLYTFFVSWPAIFGPGGIYDFGPVAMGLSFLPLGIGCSVGAACIPFFNGLYVKRYRMAGKPCPEMRLPSTFLVGPFSAVGFLWAGWSASVKIHWIVPMLAAIPIGFAMVLVFQGWLTYLGDCYRSYATSAIAATVISRSLVGATLPLATDELIATLGGIGWLYTLLGGLAMLLTPLPFLFYRYGERFRKRSAYHVERSGAV